VGPLDLQTLNAGSFSLIQCYLEHVIYLVDASVGTLSLRGSCIAGMKASRLKASGSVNFDGSTTRGQVSLVGAEIADNLVCTGAVIMGENGTALDATNLTARDLFFNDQFHSYGTVNLFGANVSGDVQYADSVFESRSSFAIIAVRATVGGSILLSGKVKIRGGIHKAWARIGGNLACYHCRIECLQNAGSTSTGIAIAADGIAVAGSVFIKEGFTITGEVRFVGADIKGDLDLTGGTLIAGNERNSALTISRANIGRGLLLECAKKPEGIVDLSYAHAAQLDDSSQSWPAANCLKLDGLTYDSLAGRASTSAEERLSWLDLQRSEPFHPQPYRQIAKVLRDQGYDDQARTISIALADKRLRIDGVPRRARLKGLILKLTIAYGYMPFRALWFIGLFVILGFLVFGSAYRAGEIVPTDEKAFQDFRRGELPGYYESFCALTYSFDTFVPIIGLGQRDKWMVVSNDTNLRPVKSAGSIIGSIFCDPTILPKSDSFVPGVVRGFHWFDILAGWFFSTMFVVGITGLVRNE
jgi:hypothetical protein